MQDFGTKQGSPRLRLGSTASILALAIIGTPALAQDAPAAGQGATAGPQENAIVVTGSRIQRSGGFDQPTPATVIGGQQVADLAIVNAGDIAELDRKSTRLNSSHVKIS